MICNNIRIREIKDKNIKRIVASEVLYDLPEWFGMPESTKSYIDDSSDMPYLAAYTDDKLAGFIVLNHTSDHTADIFVMGVKKVFHNKGIGRALNNAYESLARNLGYTYSQVKTVQTGHYKEYDITNAFYKAIGYVELECFPNMWDEWNPCQIYIKYLGDKCDRYNIN